MRARPSFRSGLLPASARRARPSWLSCLSCLTAALLALLPAIAVGLLPNAASAYPTSVVFAPSGEALPFGGFALSSYLGMTVWPKPSRIGSVWGSLNVGVLPSLDLVTTPAGKLTFAGAEVGIDVFGPDTDGSPTFVMNVKLQLVKETDYWPALAIGFFQISPDSQRGQSLGYFSLSKSFAVRDTDLGQLTLGMMRSFVDDTLIAPQCFVSGAGTCLFRGSSPFEDGNGALLAGYLSPWFGPLGFSIDHVGGTSPVSSTNFSANVRFWQDGAGGVAILGVGGFVSNDRREVPLGPGAEDGMFVSVAFVSSFGALFGLSPIKDWSSDPTKPRRRNRRADPEDLLDAPPLTAPTSTPTPTTSPTTPPP